MASRASACAIRDAAERIAQKMSRRGWSRGGPTSPHGGGPEPVMRETYARALVEWREVRIRVAVARVFPPQCVHAAEELGVAVAEAHVAHRVLIGLRAARLLLRRRVPLVP